MNAEDRALAGRLLASMEARITQEELAAERRLSGYDESVTTEDFYAYLPMHSYIFRPTRELWPAASVNERIPPIEVMNGQDRPKKMKPSAWLDRNRHVEQMTWAPGEPMLIEDRIVSDGGWIDRNGIRVFNLYRPPSIEPGDASKADRWIAHLAKVYPNEGDHILKWLAHRRQKPHEKINHALVLGGAQGVGKDTILEPVKRAVGPWNFCEVSPVQLMGRFNSYVRSVILRVSEARDLGEVNRYSFYEHMKPLTASPPDVLRCDEKNIREYSIFNATGVIITTNHKTDGIFLPPDDRRHFVAWSELSRDDFSENYWRDLYAWFEDGGHAAVCAFLDSVDLSEFDAKAPPPRTPAFYEIVDANRAPEDAELVDILEALGNPAAVTIDEVATVADAEFASWLRERGNTRKIPHRMEAAGYQRVRNDTSNDGRWRVGRKRCAVYARQSLALRDRLRAANDLVGVARD